MEKLKNYIIRKFSILKLYVFPKSNESASWEMEWGEDLVKIPTN